jgi:hypothetical protein
VVGTSVMVGLRQVGGVGSVQDIAGVTAPPFSLFPQVKHAAQWFIMRDYQTQVPLTEGSTYGRLVRFGGAEEPFGNTVRPRAARRNPDHRDAHIGKDGVE